MPLTLREVGAREALEQGNPSGWGDHELLTRTVGGREAPLGANGEPVNCPPGERPGAQRSGMGDLARSCPFPSRPAYGSFSRRASRKCSPQGTAMDPAVAPRCSFAKVGRPWGPRTQPPARAPRRQRPSVRSPSCPGNQQRNIPWPGCRWGGPPQEEGGVRTAAR